MHKRHDGADAAPRPVSPVPPGVVESPRPRKRRWGRRIAVALGLAVLLLAAVVAATPYFASSAWGRSTLLNVVNARLRGHLSFDTLAVSWGGPSELRGLRVVDPQQRDVLQVKAISHTDGLLGLIRGGLSFGKIVIDSPAIHLYYDDSAASPSLVDALTTKSASAPRSEPISIPDVRGSLAIRNGTIRAERAGSPPFDAAEIDVTLSLHTPEDIAIELAARLSGGTAVRGSATIRDLVRSGRFAPHRVAGTINLASDGAVDLGSLTRVFSPAHAVDGRAVILLTANTDAGNVQAEFGLDVAGLQSVQTEEGRLAPINLRIDGRAERVDDRLTVAAKLAGEAGTADAALAYRLTDNLPALTTDDVLAAIFHGKPLNLPSFSLDVNGAIDIARLGKAVPGLLRVQPGREIIGGRLDVAGLHVSGGARPAAKIDVSLHDVTAIHDGNTVTVQPVTIHIDAGIDDGVGLRLARTEAKAAFLEASASGVASDLRASVRGSLTQLNRELGQVFDFGDLTVGGDFTADARFACAGAGEPILSSGTLVFHGLTARGTSLLDGPATLEWNNAQVRPDEATVRIDATRFTSSAARIDATAVKLASTPALDISADVQISAELAGLFAAVAAVADQGRAPAIGGRLSFASRVETSGGAVSVRGHGGVDDLVAGDGPDALREKRVTLDVDARLDPPSDTLTLSRVAVASSPMNLELSGSVGALKSTKNLALKGRYDASWAHVTKLLHEIAPATADLFVIAGRSSSSFEITGPIYTAAARPTFRGVSTALDVGWESADVLGAVLKSATVRPTLRDGVLTIPTRAVPTTAGTVHIGGAIDFTGSAAVYRWPGTTRVFENVAITPRLAQSLLSRLNPIFYRLVQVDGIVQASVTDIVLPLGAEAASLGAGRGRLDLGDVHVQPGGFFGVLLEVLGYPTDQRVLVKFGQADFAIRGNRIVYDNFTMVFPPDVDLRFFGSVGFDDTLDLWVSVPVREALLQRLGVTGPALAYSRKLTGLRVDLPIAGTRTNPRLDFSKVDVARLVQDILLRGGADQGAEEGLRGLLRGLQGDKKEQEKEPEPPKTRERPRLRDRLKDRNKP